jgi:hypothetical protein
LFYTAEAAVAGFEIRIASASVSRPRAVRYAWVNYGKVDVFGENWLPLSPFCLR